jgi:integrase
MAASNTEIAVATSSSAEMFLRQYAMNTAIRYYRLIKDIYETAVEDHLAQNNPLTALQKYFDRMETAVAVPAPNAAIVEALYQLQPKPGRSWKKRRDRMLVLLTAETGLRRQEILSLQVDNLHLDSIPPFLRVTQPAHARRVELRSIAAATLQEWLKERSAVGVKGRLVYPTNLEGAPLDPSTAYRIIAAQLASVGAGKTELGATGARVLRSGFAHRHMTEGDSLPEIQEQLGHRQMMSTSDLLARVTPKSEK